MNDDVRLVVGTFDDEKAAGEALKMLKQALKNEELVISDAAVVRRDEHNKLHVKETADIHPGKGAVIGGVLGAVIGLLGGPAGVVLGGSMGAMVGAAAAAADTGISDYRLEEVSHSLQPGTSAVLVVVDAMWAGTVESRLTGAGAEVGSELLHPDLLAQLEQPGEDPSATS